MLQNKIQTFLINFLVKSVGFMKKFGFYKGLDKAHNPKVWIIFQR